MIKDIGLRRNKPDYFAFILGMFLDQGDSLLSELSTAIQSKDAKAVHHISHKLKGSAHSIGATSLGDHCHKLQEASQTEALDFGYAKEVFDKIFSTYQESSSLLKQV